MIKSTYQVITLSIMLIASSPSLASKYGLGNILIESVTGAAKEIVCPSEETINAMLVSINPKTRERGRACITAKNIKKTSDRMQTKHAQGKNEGPTKEEQENLIRINEGIRKSGVIGNANALPQPIQESLEEVVTPNDTQQPKNIKTVPATDKGADSCVEVGGKMKCKVWIPEPYASDKEGSYHSYSY